MTWKTFARDRVVKIKKTADKPLEMRTPPLGAGSVQIEMDNSGNLYLTRHSRDGFIQAYALLNANGNPIRYRKRSAA